MIFPDEKVVEVAKLGPLKAAELLNRGRAGDLEALADWTVYSAYRHVLRGGASPAEAIHHTRTLIAGIELTPKVSL